MKQVFQVFCRHTQRVALIFWLLSFGLPTALLAEANRLAENAPTEEVCTLTGGTIAEVVAKKRKTLFTTSAKVRLKPLSAISDFVQVAKTPLAKPALEITLRKLRI